MNLQLGQAPAATANGAAPTPDAAAELAALKARREAAEARAAAAKKAREEASSSAAAQLEAEKIALADAERRALLEEHEAKTDVVYRAACLQYGSDRVARIVTRAGSIVMRPQTEREGDAARARMAAFERKMAEAKTPEERDGFQRNHEEAARLAIGDTILSDKAHFERAVGVHFGLWGTLGSAQAALIDGRVLDEGKGGAR